MNHDVEISAATSAPFIASFLCVSFAVAVLWVSILVNKYVYVPDKASQTWYELCSSIGQMEVDGLVKNKSTIRLVDWSKKFQLGKRTMIYMLHDTGTVNLLLDWSRCQEAGVSIIAFE
jgi:hypothetical protein